MEVKPARGNSLPRSLRQIGVLLEVAERREQVEDGVEALVVERRLAVVAADKLRPLGASAPPLGLRELDLGAVQPGDAVARLGETSACRPKPTGQSSTSAPGSTPASATAPSASSRVRTSVNKGTYLWR